MSVTVPTLFWRVIAGAVSNVALVEVVALLGPPEESVPVIVVVTSARPASTSSWVSG